MNQDEADQKAVNTLLAEFAAELGRPLTPTVALSLTAAMYQRQRDDLLAALTEVLARLERVDPLPEGSTSSLRDYARRAIAAAKGETSGNR